MGLRHNHNGPDYSTSLYRSFLGGSFYGVVKGSDCCRGPGKLTEKFVCYKITTLLSRDNRIIYRRSDGFIMDLVPRKGPMICRLRQKKKKERKGSRLNIQHRAGRRHAIVACVPCVYRNKGGWELCIVAELQ